MGNHATQDSALGPRLISWRFPTRWVLWSAARPSWVVFALTCEACAVWVTVWSLAYAPRHGRDLLWFTVLLAMGLTQAEMWRQIELVRRRLGGLTHINVTSIWCLAGVVMLSPGWAALLSAALFAHLWVRVWRHISTRPAYRAVANTAYVMLSCWAAAETLRVTGLGGLADVPSGSAHGVVVVLTAAVVFELVNLLTVVTSIYLHTTQRVLSDLVGTRSDNALEVVTLCLGSLTATGLAYQPVLVLLTYPPLLLLHRQVVIKQLSLTVATDEKTGLFSIAGWRHIASRELDRVKRAAGTLAIFMVDIDHFKKVNDTYGHLVGDAVLKAVATAVRQNVRDHDAVGRFGGEEFVVLLPDIDEPDIEVVAERVRRAVNQLVVPFGGGAANDVVDSLSVSIGTAHHPRAGHTLERLIHAADAALLHAKCTGRNRITHAESAPAQASH